MLCPYQASVVIVEIGCKEFLIKNDKTMPYSKFTLSKAVEDFQLTIVEGSRFLPEIPSVTPTPLLQDILKETLPWAIARWRYAPPTSVKITKNTASAA